MEHHSFRPPLEAYHGVHETEARPYHTIVTLAKKTNSARGTALVRHVYKRVGALVVTAQEIDINVGDELWAVGDLHCFRTVVKSICVGPLPVPKATVTTPQPLGLITDPLVRKGCTLVKYA